MEVKSNKIELWIDDDQLQRWTMNAKNFKLTLWEYIRRTVDAYSNIIHQHDDKANSNYLIESEQKK